MLTGITEGRIVHYVLSEFDTKLHSAIGRHCAAIIVRFWGDKNSGCSNLMVFVDGSNDQPGQMLDHPYWATSKYYSEDMEPGTWHWPEKE